MGTKRSRIRALVSQERKRRLRKFSKGQGRSMNAVINDLLDTLPKEQGSMLKAGPGMGEQWAKMNVGILSGLIGKEELERDDRLGDLLRKHLIR